jgi:hypothetical protein
MKDKVHYGTIPGTQKPTLFKAGAEKILSTFRIAIEPVVTDLSTEDEARFRVETRATAQGTGAYLGSGTGEASSHEEKYKWRASVCQQEFDETPDDRRREVWKRGWGSNPPSKLQQVRTQRADLANTILKMAKKRSQIDATLTVTAASDVFAQDLEDLPDELRQSVVEAENHEPARAPIQQPQRKSQAVQHDAPPADARPADADIPFDDDAREDDAPADAGGPPINDAQSRRLYAIAMGAGFDKASYRAWLAGKFGINSDRDLPVSIYEKVVEAARKGPGR